MPEARLLLPDATIASPLSAHFGSGRVESGTLALLAVLDSHVLDEAGSTLEA